MSVGIKSANRQIAPEYTLQVPGEKTCRFLATHLRMSVRVDILALECNRPRDILQAQKGPLLCKAKIFTYESKPVKFSAIMIFNSVLSSKFFEEIAGERGVQNGQFKPEKSQKR